MSLTEEQEKNKALKTADAFSRLVNKTIEVEKLLYIVTRTEAQNTNSKWQPRLFCFEIDGQGKRKYPHETTFNLYDWTNSSYKVVDLDTNN